MCQSLLKDPPAALVELHAGVAHHVDGIHNQSGPGRAASEDPAMGTGEIEGRCTDLRAPLGTATFQPGGGLGLASTRHDVEQLTKAYVDDRLNEFSVLRSPSRTK